VTEGLFVGEEAVLHVMGWGGGWRGCAGTRTVQVRGEAASTPSVAILLLYLHLLVIGE
jgi:hypothetical protein